MESTVNEHQENLIKVRKKAFMFVDMESKCLMPQKKHIYKKKQHLHWDFKIPRNFGSQKNIFTAMP